jgi:phosphate-selective porin OprO and OprP
MNSKTLFTAALFATTMLSAPVVAQEAEPPVSAEEVAAMRAEMKAMRAEIAEMKAAQAKAAAPPATASPAAAVPSWKGAPQYDDKDKGFSFKPKGTIQVDAG